MVTQPLITPLLLAASPTGEPLEGLIVRAYDQTLRPRETSWARKPPPMSRGATRSGSRKKTSMSAAWKVAGRMCSSGHTTAMNCWEKARSSATPGSGPLSVYGRITSKPIRTNPRGGCTAWFVMSEVTGVWALIKGQLTIVQYTVADIPVRGQFYLMEAVQGGKPSDSARVHGCRWT